MFEENLKELQDKKDTIKNDKIAELASQYYEDSQYYLELRRSDGTTVVQTEEKWPPEDIGPPPPTDEIDVTNYFANSDFSEIIKTDFERTHWSSVDGYDTIHIPNIIIDKYLDKVADAIAKVARDRYNEMKEIDNVKAKYK